MTALKKKWISVTLTVLMVIPLVAAAMTQVQAQPPTVFTFHCLVPPGPWFDIGVIMKSELAKIGIEMVIDVAADWGSYWDVTFGDYWNYSWAEGGWDTTFYPWGWHPVDLLWIEGSYASWGMVPRGWNYYSWQNEEADDLIASCMSIFDMEERQYLAWKWQEVFMHDPPAIALDYPIGVTITDAKVQNWDPQAFFLGGSIVNVTIEGKTLEDYVTLRHGRGEDVYYLSPMFIYGEADQDLAALTHDMLFISVPDPVTGEYKNVPWLATGYPVWSEDHMHCNLTLRDNVYWHDGWKFNATDVKFTFETTIDPATIWCCGYGDTSPYIESVDIIDEYTVRFNFKKLCAHFTTLLANTWGGYIVPEHQLRDIPRRDLYNHPTNTDPLQRVVGTGPYKFVTWVPSQYYEVERNENWWGGEVFVDHVVSSYIPDPAAMLIALQTHEIDISDDLWEATRAEIEDMKTWPDLNVWEYFSVGTDLFDINLANRILSNRYMRQAIAHAIPYEHIINTVLEGYGIRAKTPIIAMNKWAFNTELPYYEYDLVKAQQYLDMWKYSQVGTDYTLGPVGDGDFSGFVEMADFAIWADRIVYGQLTPETWPFRPCHSIDPDYDNSGYVEGDDFYRWRENIGEYYPFYGAR